MRQRRKIFVTILLAGLFGAGVAFAAWSSTGSGTGTAQATTSTNSVIAAGTSAADLYPGATMSITVTISNPNPYPVLVTAISSGSSALVNSTCVAGSVTSDAKSDAAGIVRTNSARQIAGNSSGTYSLVTHMTSTAVDACKSQTFTLALTATLTSDA